MGIELARTKGTIFEFLLYLVMATANFDNLLMVKTEIHLEKKYITFNIALHKISFFFILNFIYIFIHTYTFHLTVCKCITCVPMPMESRRGHWIPWGWNQDGCLLGAMKGLGTKPGSSERAGRTMNF